jgi:hypothetical protein
MHITKRFYIVEQSSGHVKIFCSEQQQVSIAVKKSEGPLVELQ